MPAAVAGAPGVLFLAVLPAATVPAALRAHPGFSTVGHPALSPGHLATVGHPGLVAIVIWLFLALGGRDLGGARFLIPRRAHLFQALGSAYFCRLLELLVVLLGRGPFPLRVSRLVGRTFLGFFFSGGCLSCPWKYPFLPLSLIHI